MMQTIMNAVLFRLVRYAWRFPGFVRAVENVLDERLGLAPQQKKAGKFV